VFWIDGDKMANPHNASVHQSMQYFFFVSGPLLRLNNFCINEREDGTKLTKDYRAPSQLQQPRGPTILGYVSSDAPNITRREGSSVLRNVLSTRIHKQKLKYPVTESQRNVLVQKRKGLFE
jgi:hypothetical protein